MSWFQKKKSTVDSDKKKRYVPDADATPLGVESLLPPETENALAACRPATFAISAAGAHSLPKKKGGL